MARIGSATNILMEMRKLFQHPYLVAPEMDNAELPQAEQHKQLIDASGKLLFLKQLLPRLKERGHRVLLFSQFKIALDLIEDFISGEGYKYLRLDGDVNQLHRQKDMDKFNAPNSEYFIFLLTTRAGGVGINLASADTVIVHDPDFNPHQDLQAISRAHRYGQTKRVLVFKLMMENSAEVRIINSGKRKLVLDHLVVQQLGKDREEGEYENLILYGAEDITKIDEDASDVRVWTPKMIDDLIDDAEKEAEEVAKAQEAADTAKAASQAEEDASKTRGFSFAKIWETKAKEVVAPDSDEPEAEPDFDEHGWVQFLQQAEATEATQREAALAVAGRLRALKKNVRYTVDRGDFETTPEKKKNKKGKGKDLSQPTVVDRDEDDEFVPGPDFDLISDDEDLGVSEGPSDLEDLSNEQRTIIGGMAAGKRKLTKHERHLLRKWHSLDEKKRAEALAVANASNLAEQQDQEAGPPSSGAPPAAAAPEPGAASQFTGGHQPPASSWQMTATQPAPGPGPATTAQRLALLAAARQQSSLVAAAATAGEAIRRVASGEVFAATVGPPQPHQPPSSEPVSWPFIPMVPEPRHSENVATGRAVLHDLYRALQTTGDPTGHSADWGELAKFTTPTSKRKELYVTLGKIADSKTKAGQGNARRFSEMGTLVAAFYFIDSLAAMYPDRFQAPTSAFAAHHHAPQTGISQLHHGPIPPAPFANQPAWQQHRPHPAAWSAMGYGFGNTLPQPMPQPVPQPIQQPIPHRMPQPVPRRVAQPVPRVMPQPIPGPRPQPQPLPQTQLPPHALLTHQPLPPMRSHQPSPTTPHARSTPMRPHQLSPTTPHRPSTPPLQSPSSALGTSSPVRVPQLPSSPAVAERASVQTPSPATGPQPGRPSTPGSNASNVSASNVIRLSSGEAKDTGAQPVVVSAMQLGDSSRFDPQSHNEESKEADERCYWCQQDHHLRDCPGLLSLEDIKSYRDNIEASDEAADAKVQGLQALAMMEAARKERDEIESKKSKKRPRGSASGTSGDPIEIDADSRPPSRPESAAALKRVRTSATFQGCHVCNEEVVHTLAACPVVLGGVDSIKAALENFHAGSPTHDMLSKFLRAAEVGVPAGAMEPCAYCNTTCGMTVRQCAEVRGKRKDLKHKIRNIDERVLPSNEEQLRVLNSRRATTAEWELPSLERQIAYTEREVLRLERVLARLYEAYNEWPNPKRASVGGQEAGG